MSATLFALALFGCSDDGTTCQRLNMAAETYQNREACAAKTDAALETEAALKADYPTVYAQCLSAQQLAAIGKNTVDLNKMNGVRFASAD
ncbi:hypothetical protein [Novosphingobium sp. 9]|uniref:hypothetical protein n=1 Tax=Novosphingobium sp. 9 TaxID=2025349 RepID=UPI0021B6BA25|nr:hypothetical protein [Novosphingobium sp. 9]